MIHPPFVGSFVRICMSLRSVKQLSLEEDGTHVTSHPSPWREMGAVQAFPEEVMRDGEAIQVCYWQPG